MEHNPTRYHTYVLQDDTVQNPFATLPTPMIAEIITNLSASSIANTERSCKLLWKTLNDDDFFRLLCLRSPQHKGIKNGTTTWKQVYIEMLKGFTWVEAPETLSISEHGRTITMVGDTTKWQGAITRKIPSTGIHTLSIMMHSCTSGGHVYAGICKSDFDLKQGRWTIASNGAISISGVWGQANQTYKAGDIITVVADTSKKTVNLKINGKLAKFERSTHDGKYTKDSDVTLQLPPDTEFCFICSVFYKQETASILPLYDTSS